MSAVPEILTVQDAAVYLGLSPAKVRSLMSDRLLGWMFLDDRPAKRKPIYTTRQQCDDYLKRRTQAAQAIVDAQWRKKGA
jgi:hypothetical protein